MQALFGEKHGFSYCCSTCSLLCLSCSTLLSSSSSNTAYFWNEDGTDSIKFGNASIGYAQNTTVQYGGVEFGIDTDAATHISFAAGQGTSLFGQADGSSGFFIGASGNTLVSYGFATATGVTIVFAGGAEATLAGGDFTSASATGIFSNASGGSGAGTGNFGSATAIPTFS